MNWDIPITIFEVEWTEEDLAIMELNTKARHTLSKNEYNKVCRLKIVKEVWGFVCQLWRNRKCWTKENSHSTKTLWELLHERKRICWYLISSSSKWSRSFRIHLHQSPNQYEGSRKFFKGVGTNNNSHPRS